MNPIHIIIFAFSIVLVFWLSEILTYQDLEDTIEYTVESTESLYKYFEKNLFIFVLIIGLISILIVP
jgi:hypothetical protein